MVASKLFRTSSSDIVACCAVVSQVVCRVIIAV